MKLLINVWRPVVLATMLMLAGYMVYIIWLEQQHLWLTSSREARMIAATAQSAIEHAQRHKSPEEILETLQRMERSNPGLDVMVFDRDGNVFLHSAGFDHIPDDDERREVSRLVDRAKKEKLEELFELVTMHEVHVALYVLPLHPSAGSTSGYIAIALPVDYVEDGLREVRYVSIFVIISFVILNLALGAFMGRAHILEPVRKLNDNIQRLRRGEEVLLPKQSEDELGHVQAELVDLAASLHTAQEQLREELDSRRQLQLTLQERERLAAVGLVAASLAHEIGSPLQVVTGRTQELRKHLDSPEALEKLDTIDAQLQRIQRTMNQTLTMTRDTPPPRTAVCISDTVKMLSKLMEPEAKERDVLFGTELDERLPHIMANSDQLQQILFNLINNALAWTHPGDKITVRAREDEIEDMLGRTRPALLVEVEDTGEGMSEESISRIFETFFTAREERGGHGLGMPIVRHLVREHSGRIKVLSKVGEGTTVRIWLPAITEEERGSS
jgi:signal transduction histidine kinase